ADVSAELDALIASVIHRLGQKRSLLRLRFHLGIDGGLEGFDDARILGIFHKGFDLRHVIPNPLRSFHFAKQEFPFQLIAR
ncbi:MAG TPA: hypothetical protein VIU12_05280, partial [Chryseolinea sp.]